MKSYLAFMKKEFTEQLRSGRMWITLSLFVLFGIMNPTVAKLTPWLLEMMSDTLAESGMVVTGVKISAMDSWVQFFKNMPMGIIAFVLLQGAIFTGEYASGTLVLSLTKGLCRFKVVIAKSVVLYAAWSVCYWLCFGITYLYNEYFWDNSIAKNLMLSVVCWWLFGMLIVSLMTLLSTLSSSTTGVLLGTGGIVFTLYLVGLIPKITRYLPTYLTNGNSLIYGMSEAKEYIPAVIITAALTLVCFAVSIPIFNKKQL